MQRFLSSSLIIVGCLVFLSGCGVTSGAQQNTNHTSPATHSPGPTSITTDHSIYAPADLIQVTLNNGLATALYVADHQASCSIFALQQQSNGVWQALPKSLAGCPLGMPTQIIKIAAGATYQASIRAAYLHQGDGVFPTGNYRLLLHYTTIPPNLDAGAPPPTDGTPTVITAISATFTVNPA